MLNSPLAPSYRSQPSKPITLFQFWDRNIPPEVDELMQGVKNINSGLNYHFFDDSSASQFIKDVNGNSIFKLYETCAIPAMRADFFRYCYLAERGGIYVDADFPVNRSIEPLLGRLEKGCLYLRERGFANGMMFFRDPNDELAIKIRDVAIDNVSNRTSNNVWQVTGPNVIQSLYSNKKWSSLFDGMYFLEEEEFAGYFKPGLALDYKRDDSHWLVAREKGLNIYRD